MFEIVGTGFGIIEDCLDLPFPVSGNEAFLKDDCVLALDTFSAALYGSVALYRWN
jgi:hypothetical protein